MLQRSPPVRTESLFGVLIVGVHEGASGDPKTPAATWGSVPLGRSSIGSGIGVICTAFAELRWRVVEERRWSA